MFSLHLPTTTPAAGEGTGWDATSTLGAGSLIAESGIVAYGSGPWGADVRIEGHAHEWGWV